MSLPIAALPPTVTSTCLLCDRRLASSDELRLRVALGAAQDERVPAVLRPQAGIARLPVGHHVRHARHRRKTARRLGARCSCGRVVNRPGLGVDEQDDTDGATETLVGQRLRGCRLGGRVLEAAGLQLAERAEPEHAEPDHDQHRHDQHQTGAADHETSYRPGHSAPLPLAPQGRAPAFCSGHVMLPLAADPRWLGPSPALLARLFGNGTDSRLRGASPEGACRVECRGAAIGHPKVLPGRLGCGVRGSGPGRVRELRPRSGWPRRACPGRGSRAF